MRNEATVERVQLDIEKFCYSLLVDKYFWDRVDVSYRLDFLSYQIDFSARKASEDVGTETVHYPDGPLQRWKRDNLPAWIKRWWPVKYDSKTLKVAVAYEGISLPDQPHFFYFKAELPNFED